MEPMEPERIRGMRGDDTLLVVCGVVVLSGEAGLLISLFSDGAALSLFIVQDFISCLSPKTTPLLL